MNISTFARRVGISPSGVRWYESAGILPPPTRRPNGYREYTDADCSRLRMILALRRLGLTPDEAGRLAAQCLDGGAVGAELVGMLERQRRRIAQQREELERLELELGDLETSIEATEVCTPSRAARRARADRRPLRLQRQLGQEPAGRGTSRSLRRHRLRSRLGRHAPEDGASADRPCPRRGRDRLERRAREARRRAPSTVASTTWSRSRTAPARSARRCPEGIARSTGTSRTRRSSRAPRRRASRRFARLAPSCRFGCGRSSRSHDARRDAFPQSPDPEPSRLAVTVVATRLKGDDSWSFRTRSR